VNAMPLIVRRFYRAASLSHAKIDDKTQSSRALFHIGIAGREL